MLEEITAVQEPRKRDKITFISLNLDLIQLFQIQVADSTNSYS